MKLSDIYNSICIDSSVENKNCILLKLYFTYNFVWKPIKAASDILSYLPVI